MGLGPRVQRLVMGWILRALRSSWIRVVTLKKALKNPCAIDCEFACAWVVVKIMVPFWVPIIIRHLLFRVPKKPEF